MDADGEIQEKFLGFYECQDGIRGEDIANLVLTTAAKLGLDMSKCRGQCYDGAGNMAGKIKGAATRIRNEYPKAVYVHCTAHVLNLCVV